jgi:hypothetical protein
MLADPALAGAIEADLRRFYRVDLRELRTGGLRVRQLCVFIRGLPADSAMVGVFAARARASQPAPEPAKPKFSSASDVVAMLGGLRK